MLRSKSREALGRVVGRSVVDHDALPQRRIGLLPHDVAEQRQQRRSPVMRGNDERKTNHRAKITIYMRKTCRESGFPVFGL